MDILRSYIDKFEALDGGKYSKFYPLATDICFEVKGLSINGNSYALVFDGQNLQVK